jgi:hypothetical protein
MNIMAQEDQIKFTLDADLKKRFQMKCLEEGVKMTPVLRELIENWIDGDAASRQFQTSARIFFQKLAQQKYPSEREIAELANFLDLSEEELLEMCDRLFPEKN